MLNGKRILWLALSLSLLSGCAMQPQVVTTAPKPGKPSKSTKPKRYLDIPMDTSVSSGIRFPKSSRTVDDVLDAFAPSAIEQLGPWFKKAGVAYPPNEIVLIAIKDEKKLELWARDTGPFKLVKPYGIRAASGMRGPKLKQGDRQVPEGIYHISRLNPNSNYHLSMKVDYPNQFDRDHAMDDGRSDLGGISSSTAKRFQQAVLPWAMLLLRSSLFSQLTLAPRTFGSSSRPAIQDFAPWIRAIPACRNGQRICMARSRGRSSA